MKISIITGASSGLGAEFARQIYKQNTSDEIWLVARRVERLEKLKAELGERCRIFALDLTDDNSIEVIKRAIENKDITLDYLVNGAGFGKFGNYDQVSSRDNADMIKLNIGALVSLTQAVLPIAKKGSKIIQIASVSAFMPLVNLSVYGASKAFVLNYSRALRAEIKKAGVKVTALCPGWVDTEFSAVASNGGNVNRPKKLKPITTPDKVVKRAIKDVNKNKAVSTYGATWKLMRLFCKILPKSLMIKVWQLMQKTANE